MVVKTSPLNSPVHVYTNQLYTSINSV